MKRDEALAILRSQEPKLKKRFGIMRMGIFGSVARDEAGEESDVDVVVEMPADLFAMVHLKELLEEAFDQPVDLVRYRDRMNPFLKRRIERDALYV